jgi:hypothetical protein
VHAVDVTSKDVDSQPVLMGQTFTKLALLDETVVDVLLDEVVDVLHLLVGEFVVLDLVGRAAWVLQYVLEEAGLSWAEWVVLICHVRLI